MVFNSVVEVGLGDAIANMYISISDNDIFLDFEGIFFVFIKGGLFRGGFSTHKILLLNSAAYINRFPNSSMDKYKIHFF